MNVNELRVGNYIDNNVECFQIQAKDLIFLLAFDNEHYANPIPITEEWLIKLGFIKMPVNGYDYLLKISAATLQCRRNGDKWYFQFNDTYFGEMFPYVHQVQNFCASLGKELISA